MDEESERLADLAEQLGELLGQPDSVLVAVLGNLTQVQRAKLSRGLRIAERAAQGQSELVESLARVAEREWAKLMPQAAGHTGLQAHDGYAAHSHEVRADHLGVERVEPGGPAGVLGIGIPYAYTDPDSGTRTCPTCSADFAEDYDDRGERLSDNYGDHYRQWHASLPHGGQG